ncbi:hypothetical protein AVEN_179201-1 [Araneus ventricosus]|uniref:Uncharacterized protein n=1 Tax=Araneus ventricosus TaxID=182803 RepID=A0A4Y2C8M0_ARAVE|nr:hypothetical protein AVEN_179201-1 [Araneus ventricosus]
MNARTVVARGFLGSLDRSGEMSVNSETSKASVSTDGDLSKFPADCCRLCTLGTGQIQNDNKSSNLTSRNQATDRGSKALDT